MAEFIARPGERRTSGTIDGAARGSVLDALRCSRWLRSRQLAHSPPPLWRPQEHLRWSVPLGLSATVCACGCNCAVAWRLID
jgi:hypothetical protein